MKKDNRGFTLIELLLTIALLAVISIISFVSINAIINKNKDNDCVSVVNNIIMAAKEYYSDKRYNETYTTSSITITAASLLAGNYLNGEITDPYTKEQIAGSEIKVIIQLNDDKTIKDVIVTESDGATPIFRSCKNGSGNVMSGIRITKKPTQSYQINYLLHGGKLTNTPPNTVAYEENVVLTNPTKTITVLTNANSNPSAHAEGATISASSVVATQEFLGWSSNTSYGLGSNATRGTTNNPTTSWNGNKTKDDHFFHLRNEVGTVTMVANWQETNITLPEITKEGHTCGWMTKEDGTAIEYASQGWFTPSASTTKLNVNLYAVCNVTTYTITYTLNGGKNNTNNPSSYTIESDDITLANATKTVKVTGNANNTGASVGAATSKAQTFAGWTGSNGTTAQTGVIIPKGSTGDKSYNAKWTPVAMTLPTVVKDYYTCEWWSASTGGSKVGDSGGAYTPTANSKANITVYARCNPVNYTISYTLNGGKNNTNNPSNYTIESSNITIGAATKTVKVTGNANNTGASVGAATSKVQTFKGWTGDNGTTAQTSFTIPTGSTGNKSYTANWTPVAMTLPTISNDGYTCEWWSASSGGSKVGDSGGAYTPTANSKANITVYARCNPVTYTISYTLNNGTNNANNPTSYTIESSNITIAAATKTVKVTGNVNNTGASVGAATSKAQTFKGWTGANGSTAQTGVTIPKGSFGNKSYTANWTPVAMTLPTVTKNYYTCEWWSASSGGSKVGNSGGAYTPTANSKASITVYARCTGNTYTATFYYSNNGTATSTTAQCTVANDEGICEVTIPTTVRNSKGTYNNVYAGLSTGMGNMTSTISSSSTKITISSNTSYYSVYSSAVTIYYPSSTTTSSSTVAYRNQWFASKTALAQTVLSTTATGTTDNYAYTSGISGYSLAGIATAVATNTTNYTDVAGLKNSTTTKAYVVLSKSITATFYYHNGSSQASATAAAYQYVRCTSTGAGVSNSNISIPTVVSKNSGSHTYIGVSNTTNSSTITTPNTGTKKYYAVYSQTFTASFAKGTGVKSIGATSKSCDSNYLTNGTIYNSTPCEITLPTITASSGYKNAKWYDNDNNVIGIANDVINSTSNTTFTAKASKRLELGDYVKMTPTLTTFTTDTTKTGYVVEQTFSPSKINLWRVIKINGDDTYEIISVGVGGASGKVAYQDAVVFAESVGYKNFVGYLNELASKYENSDYTMGSRHFGYSNQTEYLPYVSTNDECSTDGNCAHHENVGGGDTGYTTDINLVMTALGTLLPETDTFTHHYVLENEEVPGAPTIDETIVAQATYFVASRYYHYFYPYLITLEARKISGNISTTDNLTGETTMMTESARLTSTTISRYYSGSYIKGWSTGAGLRPILILKPNLTYTGKGTKDEPYIVSK